MILVDTSVWIELVKGHQPAVTGVEAANFATCGPVVQEVLQGMPHSAANAAFRQVFLALPTLSDPLPRALFEIAAEIFQSCRSRGHTIRSPADCLIAAIALENRVPVWHCDRDFETIARFTSLRTLPL